MSYRLPSTTVVSFWAIVTVCTLWCGLAMAYPPTLEQRLRLQTYLPQTFIKLESRDPVHVVALGDGNLQGYTLDPAERASGDALSSFSGVFLHKLAQEFFYTGGVRQLNAPSGVRAKVDESKGPEIWLETLASPGQKILTGLQRVRADAFLHKPDLIIIQYGMADALDRTSMFSFRLTLYRLLEECRQQNTDVILLGPTPINKGSGAMEWGITRPYAAAVEGMAQAQNLLYLDPGNILIGPWGGAADPQAAPLAGTAVIGDRLRRMFFISGAANPNSGDRYLNQRAHEHLGSSLFYQLIDGVPKSDFVLAGTATLNAQGEVEVAVSMRNVSKAQKSGIVGAMTIGGLRPKIAAQRYDVAPNQSASLSFTYGRPSVGKSAENKDVLYPLELNDESIRFPFVVEDGQKSEFLELPLRLRPVSIAWKSPQHIDVSQQIALQWDFVNGTDKAIQGTYKVGIGSAISEARGFSVAALSKDGASAILPLEVPGNTGCFQNHLFVEVSVGGASYRFTREFEASRDLVLGEKTLLSAAKTYAAGPSTPRSVQPGGWNPSVYFDALSKKSGNADAGLYAVVDLSGLQLPATRGDSPALRVELTIDARNSPDGDVRQGRARDYGVVSPITIDFPSSGGKGKVYSIPVGAFGDNQNLSYPSSGIGAVLRDQKVQLRVPKAFLNQHDWSMDEGSIMGVGVTVSIADPSQPGAPFTIDRSYQLNSPTLYYQNEAVRGMSEQDARSLSTLRFSRTPVDTWSVRIY